MRQLLIVIFLTSLTSLTSPTRLYAQGLGYAEGGLACVSGFFRVPSSTFHVGGGGEVVVDDRLGFGGEIGVFNRFVTAGANATVHLAKLSQSRVAPFITGGYTYFGVGDGSFSAFNVGAGVHYWAADRVGFRVEFRDHFRPDDRGTVQYWSLRAGIAFR
jgi:hypothetical protein